MPAPGLLVPLVVSLVHSAVLAGLSELRPFCWDPVLPQRPPEVPVVVLVAVDAVAAVVVVAVVVLEQVVATKVEPEELEGAVGVAAGAVVAPAAFVAFPLPVRA